MRMLRHRGHHPLSPIQVCPHRKSLPQIPLRGEHKPSICCDHCGVEERFAHPEATDPCVVQAEGQSRSASNSRRECGADLTLGFVAGNKCISALLGGAWRCLSTYQEEQLFPRNKCQTFPEGTTKSKGKVSSWLSCGEGLRRCDYKTDRDSCREQDASGDIPCEHWAGS